jgi:hypothetical protein
MDLLSIIESGLGCQRSNEGDTYIILTATVWLIMGDISGVERAAGLREVSETMGSTSARKGMTYDE